MDHSSNLAVDLGKEYQSSNTGDDLPFTSTSVMMKNVTVDIST